MVRKMKRKILLIALFSIVFDQIIKYIFSTFITGFTVIPGFLSFIYVKNTGVAFSMLSNQRIFIIVISIILLIILGVFLKRDYLYLKKDDTLTDVTYGFLFGGILGNLIDRIFRGYVVDYVSLNIFGYDFPIFNLADVLITVGVIILFIITIRNDKKKTS